MSSQEPAAATGTAGDNPLVHRDRRLSRSESSWVKSFACEDMGILIVCRGPIRKEAIDVFREMGIPRVGMLLSEKDSIVFSRALAPELRIMDPARVHAVPDYSGATKEERFARIADIVRICRENDYGYVFAGYGFMAEDASFVRAIEDAGLSFVGPCSSTQTAAGAKDQAKRTAIANQVSVTPGINDATVRTLLARHPDAAALRTLAERHGLSVPALADPKAELVDAAAALLEASYARQLDLFTIDDLAAQLREEAAKLLSENPGRRFRLKAIGGGGGKGQRIFSDAEVVPGLVREVLSEVKATGPGDNRNMLLELNVESTRHNEIQLLGNGKWCIALGGRDCSLQMHEQKLVEVSITQEGLHGEIDRARGAGEAHKSKILESDLEVLRRMEAEAERFGLAVGLDSASTFECIVEGSRHFFMEVNTRIQVEHRVSELCYALRFANPEDRADAFVVHSLVEAMALVARHKGRLPRPERIRREGAAIEVRVNATDRALSPAAGGVIVSWSDPSPGEIRDDQGISIKNPDTGLFMRYRLAGAYDSNVALLLATGHDRGESWENLTEVLRRTSIRGIDLATNREFLYGLMVWFGSRDPWAKPTTKFVVPYLTAVGELAREAGAIDLDWICEEVPRRLAAASGETSAATRAA
ncbi:MAG: biotin carboxylase N-terminal domain-containing protein, partial [Alphaproteobacteria bacterium]